MKVTKTKFICFQLDRCHLVNINKILKYDYDCSSSNCISVPNIERCDNVK